MDIFSSWIYLLCVTIFLVLSTHPSMCIARSETVKRQTGATGVVIEIFNGELRLVWIRLCQGLMQRKCRFSLFTSLNTNMKKWISSWSKLCTLQIACLTHWTSKANKFLIRYRRRVQLWNSDVDYCFCQVSACRDINNECQVEERVWKEIRNLTWLWCSYIFQGRNRRPDIAMRVQQGGPWCDRSFEQTFKFPSILV